MNTIIVMSLTGGCMSIGYFIVKKLLGRKVSHRFYYLWCRICLVSFMLPLVELKRIYSYVLRTAFDVRMFDIIHAYNRQSESYVFLNENDMLEMSTQYRMNMILILLWASVMILLFLVQLIRYCVRFRQISGKMVKKDKEYGTQIEHLKHAMKIRRKISVYGSDGYAAFGGGLFHPYIVVSDTEAATIPDSIFCHELYHMKRFDLIFQWLAFIVYCVHWFNPVTYFLKEELTREMELSCDELVILKRGEEEREQYAALLVAQSRLKPSSLFWTQYMATTSKKRLKERIECVMKKRTTGKVMKWVTGTVMAATVMLSSFTVMAYDDVSEFTVDESMVEAVDDFWVGDSQDFNTPDDAGTVDTYTVIDENGNEYAVDNFYMEGMEPHNWCPHVYEDCSFNAHSKHSDGSCTVKQYYAKKCTACGAVVVGDLYATHIYEVCPH